MYTTSHWTNTTMPVSLITVLPDLISIADHHAMQAATPASFADIPPVLRYQQDGIDVTFEPPIADLSSEVLTQGTIYISESALIYFSHISNRGFKVDYPVITLHAISRSESGPSIYCQLDESAENEEQPTDADDFMREMTLAPQNAETLESIFENLSFCASLHPDPPSSGEETDGHWSDGIGDFEAFTGDEDQELSEVGRVRSDFTNDSRYRPY
jgi:nucleotide-sensitive chloride channel 1A